MTNDAIRSLIDQYALAWGRADAAAIGACYTDDCVVISPLFRTLKGRAQVEKSYVDLFKAFDQLLRHKWDEFNLTAQSVSRQVQNPTNAK